MSNPNPNKATRFKKSGRPTLAKKIIGVRLPEEMDASVRELAGNDLSEWVRQAIAERLERELESTERNRVRRILPEISRTDSTPSSIDDFARQRCAV